MADEEFTTIEEVQAALDGEQQEWEKAGLSVHNLQMGNVAPMLLDMQAKIQALINLLITSNTLTEEEINLEYKKIILNDMRQLRENAPKMEQEQIRQQILRSIHLPNGASPGKPPWLP